MTDQELMSIVDSYNGDPARALVNLLKERGLTITFAESCTGGLASSGIVGIPGASEIFYGGVVSYDNSVKENVLKVSKETLDTVGAVSYECAEQMASGVRKLMNTDIAVSATGVAGPGGGSVEKPVGTVFVGYSDSKRTISIKTFSEGDRQQIRNMTCLKMYALVLSFLTEKDEERD